MATYDASLRDEKFRGDFAAYLVDLHDNRGTFNFCSGMMFQIVLSEKLRGRLAASEAASWDKRSLGVYDTR